MRKLLTMAITGVALCAAVPATSAFAQGAAAGAVAPGVAGEWNASYNTPGGARSFKVLLQAEGAKLTGTVKREAGDSPLTGSLKGDTVTFTYTIKYGENDLAMTVVAKVTGDAMKGTVDFAGQAQEAFEAKKIAVEKK